MKKLLTPAILLSVTAFVLNFISCSTTPTAGTETGNPDITACLATALQSFDTTDEWVPSRYLPEGESQLDPNRLNEGLNRPVIAKKMASQDTAEDVVEKIIVQRNDTVIIYDTLVVKDTLLLDTLILDSVTSHSDDPIFTETVKADYLRYDTVFVRDTVVRVDTIVQVRYDTLDYKTAASEELDSLLESVPRVIYRNYAADTVPVYTVSRNDTTGGIEVVQKTTQTTVPDVSATEKTFTPDVKTGVVYLTVSRVTTTPENTLSESYTFINDSEAPAAFYGSESETTPLSHGTISSTAPEREMVLEFDFDAGNDKVYTTTEDNRLLSLQQKRIIGNQLYERISYGTCYFGLLSDSVLLLREQFLPSGIIKKQSVSYRGVPGAEDTLDHRNNRLMACMREIEFNNLEVKSCDLDILLDSPLEKGLTPSTAKVSGVVNFGEGVNGLLEGVVDFQEGTIYGTYFQEGVEYEFLYNRSDSEAVLTKVSP